MKLWLITQSENSGYDTYSDAVVAAETEDEARQTHPGGSGKWDAENKQWGKWDGGDWTAPDNVSVRLIGHAAADIPAGVVCSSFHAG